jgi:hypothetical protein
MLKKVTSLLISAVMVLASAQVRVFAQTLAQSAHEGGKQAKAKQQPDFSAAIGGLLAKSRVEKLIQSDLKRFERGAEPAEYRQALRRDDRKRKDTNLFHRGRPGSTGGSSWHQDR